MTILRELVAVLLFPGGAFVLLLGLAYEWLHRKLIARMQNRVGPRWFQPERCVRRRCCARLPPARRRQTQ